MRRLTESKVHYKMYKKGRMWLIAGVATLTLQVVSLTGHADTDNTQTDVTTQNTDAAATLQNKTVTLTSSENKTSSTDATSQSATVAVSNEDTQTSVSSSQSQSAQTSAEATSSSSTSAVSASSATSSAVTDSTSQASESDTTTSATSTDTSSAATSTATDQAASESSSTATSTTSNESTSAVSSDSQSSTVNEATDSKVAAEDNNQLKTLADETTTAVIKSSAKSQLAKAAVTTTGYDDPSNLNKGISGSSKWYVTSTGELHFEAGTLGNIVAFTLDGDDDEVLGTVQTGEIPWYGYADSITTIIFDGPVKTDKSIAGVFSELQNMESIQNLNLFDTSNAENMDGLFYDDMSLTSLDLSNFNTKNVTTMFMMFAHCTALTSLDVSTFDTSNVTNMGSMFLECKSLASLDVSNFNTSQVTNMAAMFAILGDLSTGQATHLYGLDLSNFDTSKVTNMMAMFLVSSNLTSLNLSSFDTSQVTNMGGMFGGTSSLTSLDLSNLDMRQVTSSYDDLDDIGFMTNQTALKTLKLSANNRLVVGGIDSELPDVPTDGLYMGKWISKTTGKTYTSAELMALYADTAQAFADDTFVWQGVVIVQDTNLIVGPKTGWSASDNYSSESTQSFDSVTVIVDGVLGGKVDPTKPGTYQVSYQYTIDGVTYTSEAATVTVVASQANITAENKTLTQNQTWDAETAFTGGLDAAGNAIDFTDVKVSGETVDTSKTGTYNVTYSYTDDAGNEKSVTIIVTVEETTAMVNAEDKTVTQGSTWNPESGFTDGVDGNGNALSFSDVKVSGDPVDTSKTGTYKVTYSYTDQYGNEVTKDITVTVEATTATVNAKDVTLTQGETWKAEAGFVDGTDVDGNAISFSDVTVSGDSVDTSKTGTYQVTYTYTDKYGNEVSQTVTVTVEATSATVNAKDVTLTQGDTWKAEAGFVDGTDVDGNAISFADVKVSGDSVDTSKTGTYQVTYTYTDKYGNEVSQMVTVTVEATSATVNAKDVTLTQGDTWKAETGFVSGTDVDGNAISFSDVTVSGDSVDTSKTGTYQVTYTYTDKYGNEVSQTVTVTVEATSATVNAKDVVLTQGDTWNAEAGFVGGTDADGNTIDFADVKVSGDLVDTKTPGTYRVTYTYTDKYGNEVSQTIAVTVEATSATVNAKDVTLTQGDTWKAEAGFVDGTDADGNAINFADVKVSGDSVDTSKTGIYQVTYTYTDKYGNEVSQMVTVTVEATSATVNAKDVTLTQGDIWNAEVGFIGGTDTDDNAINFADVKVSGNIVDTSKTGTYQVTYTYTDKYGNEVSQTITVTVEATSATVSAKDMTLTQGDTWKAEAGFVGGTDVDGNTIDFADVTVSGDSVDTTTPGTYQVTYTYTDKYGNEVSQIITVTVEATNATVNAKDVTLTQGDTWNAEVGFIGGTDTDDNAINFSDVKVSGNIVDTSKTGTYQVTYTYTDKYGNEVSQTITVTVEATSATVNAKDVTLTQGDTWKAEAGFVGGTDADGNAINLSDVKVSGDSVDTTTPGTYRVTYTYTDKYGNEVSQMIVVTVEATSATVNAKDVTLTQGDTWKAEAGFVGGTDADGNAINLSDVKVSGDLVDTTTPGVYRVTYTYTDKYGNEVSQTIAVTVEATSATVNAKDVTLTQGDTWKAEAGFVDGTDADGDAISFTDVKVSGDSVDMTTPGTYQVTYTYTDKYGNEVSQTITVTVKATGATVNAKDVTLTQGETWKAEAGFVSGTDADGNTINFSDVKISGDIVDTSKTGVYKVTYSYIDQYGNKVIKDISVTVEATTATVNAKDVTITQGDTWKVETGFTGGTDVDGNAINLADITVSGDSVDTSKTGTYQVTYTYTDKYGNEVSQTITVTVEATSATVNAKDVTLTQGDTWKAETGFVSGTDADGNAINFSDVKVSGDVVDMTTSGTYQVTYTYTDKYGNEVSQTITVTVKATSTTVNAKDVTLAQGDVWKAEAGFVGGTDADGNTINFANMKVSGDSVDTKTPGTYQVTYTYTDKYGNEVSQTITVTVKATNTTVNAKDVTLTQGDTWDSETGFVGGTDADGNAIDFTDVKVSGDSVDTTTPGTYQVTYTYTDKYGNEVSQTITVTVKATNTTVNAKDVTLTQGDTWDSETGFVGGTDADGNAIDFTDVKVSGDSVDTTTPGTYQVTYTYTDKYGNEVSQTITVTVEATSATINAKDVTLTQGDTWKAEAGFVGGTDTNGNTISFVDVKVSGDSVDTTTPGTYQVTYIYTDKYGNEVFQTITVTVVAKDTGNNGGGTDTGNNGNGNNGGGTDTGDNGNGNNGGGTDTGDGSDGNNGGGTNTGDNGNGNNGDGTDTGDNGNSNNGDGTDIGNANGAAETDSDADTATTNTDSTITTTSIGSTVNEGYQASSTEVKTVELNAKIKGTAVDQITKSNLPQTGEITKKTPTLVGLVLLGLTSLLALAGVKRQRVGK